MRTPWRQETGSHQVRGRGKESTFFDLWRRENPKRGFCNTFMVRSLKKNVNPHFLTKKMSNLQSKFPKKKSQETGQQQETIPHEKTLTGTQSGGQLPRGGDSWNDSRDECKTMQGKKTKKFTPTNFPIRIILFNYPTSPHLTLPKKSLSGGNSAFTSKRGRQCNITLLGVLSRQMTGEERYKKNWQGCIFSIPVLKNGQGFAGKRLMNGLD